MDSVIACAMLTANRPEMAARAIRSFRAQGYANKKLLIYDTGEVPIEYEPDPLNIVHIIDHSEQLPLCELMNHITEVAMHVFDPWAIAKWDDDDVSSPDRLTDQANTLFRSGLGVTGYNDMPFVMPDRSVRVYRNGVPSYALGTSLMYTPEAWTTQPFPDTSGDPVKRGRMADTAFVHYHASRCNLIGVSGKTNKAGWPYRMLATIHAGSTSAKLEDCVPHADEHTTKDILAIFDNA